MPIRYPIPPLGLLGNRSNPSLLPRALPRSKTSRFVRWPENHCKSFVINGGGNRIRTGAPLLAKRVRAIWSWPFLFSDLRCKPH